MKVDTVVIETKEGPVVINADDFDPDTHKLYNEKKKVVKRVVKKAAPKKAK